MLDSQQRECCDLCSEPIEGEHFELGGRVVCRYCAVEIARSVDASIDRKLSGIRENLRRTAQEMAREIVQRERLLQARTQMN